MTTDKKSSKAVDVKVAKKTPEPSLATPKKGAESTLQQELSEKRTLLNDQRRSLHAGELSNTTAIRKTRREIAVIMTRLNQQSNNVKEEA